MRVSVFGLGYVGCVTAACLARAGHHVIGVDINPDKVAMVNAGTSPLVAPGLGELLTEVTAAGQLRSSAAVEDAISGSDLALICVGTSSRDNGQLDVKAVRRVAEQVGQCLRRRPKTYTVVLRSTVLPGTTESTLVPALRGPDAANTRNLTVAVNPEFLREGSALLDFARPPLTLVGADTPQATSMLQELYAGIDAPFVETSIRSAEMAKFVSNAFHALKIAFANEIGDLRESPMVLLVETLIGKGCDVRILDRNVSIARLGGANRRYIEEEIPHIASLMCDTPEDLIAHAEVLLIANVDDQARKVLKAVRPDQLVVDLSRGGVR